MHKDCPECCALQHDWKVAGFRAFLGAEALCNIGRPGKAMVETRIAVALFRKAEEWGDYYNAVQLLLVVAFLGAKTR